jgi:hypothetical protein
MSTIGTGAMGLYNACLKRAQNRPCEHGKPAKHLVVQVMPKTKIDFGWRGCGWGQSISEIASKTVAKVHPKRLITGS